VLRLQLDTLRYVRAGCHFNWTLRVKLQRVAPSTGHCVLRYSGLRLQLDTVLGYSGLRLQLDTVC
jgi:hypothetical protein